MQNSLTLAQITELYRRRPPPCSARDTHALEASRVPPVGLNPRRGLSPSWMGEQPWPNFTAVRPPDSWYADVPRPAPTPAPGERPTVSDLTLERYLGSSPTPCSMCGKAPYTYRATYRHGSRRGVQIAKACDSCTQSLRSGRLPGEPWQPLTGRLVGHFDTVGEDAPRDEDAEEELYIHRAGPHVRAEDEEDGITIRSAPLSVQGRVFIVRDEHPRQQCAVCMTLPVTHSVNCTVWASGEERRFTIRVCEVDAERAQEQAWRRIRA